MKISNARIHFVTAAVGLFVSITLIGCGKSAEEKSADDTAAIRAMMEKAEAEKKVQQEKSKANFAKMRQNAEESAKRQGHDSPSSGAAR